MKIQKYAIVKMLSFYCIEKYDVAKSSYGVLPGNYITRQEAENAKAILEEDDTSIIEIQD